MLDRYIERFAKEYAEASNIDSSISKVDAVPPMNNQL